MAISNWSSGELCGQWASCFLMVYYEYPLDDILVIFSRRLILKTEERELELATHGLTKHILATINQEHAYLKRKVKDIHLDPVVQN